MQYGVIKDEDLGAYYRGMAAKLPPCPFCKNDTIYVYLLGEQKEYELAQCLKCQASAPVPTWKGQPIVVYEYQPGDWIS